MTAADAIISRLGVTDATTDGSFAQDNELFLKVWSGEVLAAFEENNIFKPLHMVRTINSGKSAQFPATWKVNASYHVPGTPTYSDADQVKHNERVIHIDDLLKANVVINDLDEAKNHYDVRGIYSTEVGRALAREYDKNVAKVIVKAARASATVDGAFGGSVLNKGATVETDGLVLGGAMFDAAQTFDEKDIPDTDRFCAVRPAQYYLLVQAKDFINQDFGGLGAISEGNVEKIAGIPLMKTNHLPSTNIASGTAGENNDYTGDFTNTVAACFHKSAAGTVQLKDLTSEMSGSDFHIMYQGTMLLSKYAVGHGILRPESSIEISKAP